MLPDELALELEEMAEDLYERLNEMRILLRNWAPEAYRRADAYWLAHIDGALLNRSGILGGSLVSLAETLKELRDEYPDEPR